MHVSTPRFAVDTFLPEVERVLAGLSMDRESFEVRVSQCTGELGETDDNIFHIWVGVRGFDANGDMRRQLEATHARWQARGWDITLFETLENGGIQLAATDPSNRNSYRLDSGFDAGSGTYVVGFFNTPCFLSPDGAIEFGEIHAASIDAGVVLDFFALTR